MRLPQIILASQSPRRRQLLETLGLPYRVEVPKDEEEEASPATVEEVTLRNSHRKATACLKLVKDPTDIIIGADTLVVLGEEVLGKPVDRNMARATLQKLSGQTHQVITAVTLLSPKFGTRQLPVFSRVTFRTLNPSEIENYISTREPYDKAGAYAVQGLGALFIGHIEGSYTNVMGLPIEALLLELAELSGISVYDWFK
jgi:septum formation protein